MSIARYIDHAPISFIKETVMKLHAFIGALLRLALFLTMAGAAGAAEIKVFSTIGVRSMLQDLSPRFESATGHKLVITFDVANALKRRIDSGEAFDVAILTVPVMDDMVKNNKIAADTRITIARGGMGLAVRTGAAKADVSSPDAFKRVLLNAKSIAYPKEGLAGIHVVKVQERLGIAEAMGAKATLTGATAPADLVARGEVELAAHIIPELLANKGVELIGPFPPELQTYIVLPAGLSTSATEAQAGRDLLKYLTGPEAISLIRSKGYEPG